MRTLILATALVFLAACRTAEPTPSGDSPAGTPVRGEVGPLDIVSEADFRAMHELRAEAAPKLRGEDVDLDGSRAYLSLPEGGSAPYPAVIVIHEWWGLNDHIRHWADRLAADGYAALAIDLYGGQQATTPDAAMTLMKAVDDEASVEVLRKAHAFLVDDPRVQATRTGSVGWCFGGKWSLRAALELAELDAAVIYYGRLVTDPERLKTISAPLLGVFANQDKGIPPSVVDEFEAALGAASVGAEILRYDADHAFANPSSGRYDAEAASDAWRRVRAFLAEHLRTAAPDGG